MTPGFYELDVDVPQSLLVILFIVAGFLAYAFLFGVAATPPFFWFVGVNLLFWLALLTGVLFDSLRRPYEAHVFNTGCVRFVSRLGSKVVCPPQVRRIVRRLETRSVSAFNDPEPWTQANHLAVRGDEDWWTVGFRIEYVDSPGTRKPRHVDIGPQAQMLAAGMVAVNQGVVLDTHRHFDRSD